MIVLSVNVSIIVTQCDFINVGDGVGHSVETIRLAIILKENKVGVRHSENSQDKHKNEIFDVLDHRHQHPNVISCVSKDTEKVEEPNPHYNGRKRVQSSNDFRVGIIGLVICFDIFDVKSTIHNLCDNNQYNQALVHVIPYISEIC
jgi:hypothetical protein